MSISETHSICESQEREGLDMRESHNQSAKTFCCIVFVLMLFPIEPFSSPAEAEIDSLEKLGEMFFFDPIFSFNGKTSCGSCHQPRRMFTDGVRRPTGGRKHIEGGRNTPTLLGVARLPNLSWDGGIATLDQQALRPITSPIEMDRDLEELLREVNQVPSYRETSQRLFGSAITKEMIATSLAQYMRTLERQDTPYDSLLAGESTALSGKVLEGYRLFSGKAGCIECHSGSDLTDAGFHNLGVPPDGPLRDDWGRYGITKHEEDRHKFKTPTLKGAAHTAPYMHNGVFDTLGEVLEFKNQGCGTDDNLSPSCRPLHLTPTEVTAIIEFLRVL